jgi:hypothetical protein
MGSSVLKWVVFFVAIGTTGVSAFSQSIRFTEWKSLFVPAEDSLLVLENRFADLNFSYGLIGNSLFEKQEGGHGHSLYAIAVAPDKLPTDSIEWTAISMFNLRTTTDTLDFTVLLVPVLDSQHLKERLLLSIYQNTWVQDFSLVEGDTFIKEVGDFVLDKYLLPLPCNHWPMEVNYYGPEDVTLIIDDDVANGLTLADVLKFLNERKIHIESYHGAHCFDRMNRIKLQIFSRNLEISVMTDFVESLTDSKTKLEVDFVE